MIKAEVLDAMLAHGCTAEQIVAAVKASMSRSSGAERQARYRAKNSHKSDDSDVTLRHSDTSDVTPPSPLVPPDKETSPKPPKEINPPISPQPPTREADEFERWYAHFPNKVGKGAALKAWPAARKQASYEQLCGGLRRYIAKTDDRHWCNPATWLNQGRWLDEPPVPRASKPKGAELFFVEAERLKNERNSRQPWEDGSSDRRDVNGFPILELEYKSGDR